MRYYYAGYNYYGVRITYKQKGIGQWDVYRFPSRASRDTWIDKNGYDGRQCVAEWLSAKEARQIIGYVPCGSRLEWLPDERGGEKAEIVW